MPTRPETPAGSDDALLPLPLPQGASPAPAGPRRPFPAAREPRGPDRAPSPVSRLRPSAGGRRGPGGGGDGRRAGSVSRLRSAPARLAAGALVASGAAGPGCPVGRLRAACPFA